MDQLNYYLNIIKTNKFSDYKNVKYINKVEEILMENKSLHNTDIYNQAVIIISYYFGKTHNYNKAQNWFNKIPEDKLNNSWKIFKKMIFPISSYSENDEKETIKRLKDNLDDLSKIPNLNLNNLLFLDHSFWYGYIDNNPLEIYEKYANLQIKSFPSLYSQNLIKLNEKKNNKIKIGIISAGLIPSQLLNDKTIHKSSISDSFYSTFLNLSKDKFDVIYIYYKQNDPFIINDTNVYIPTIEPPTPENIQRAQRKIASQNLDILLFLDLHIEPMLNFIALSKLAKIQMCTHGHPVTSGIPRNIMNYFISWEAAEIESAQEHYTEELILLPKNIVWEKFIPRNKDEISMQTGIYWGDMTREDLNFLPDNIDLKKNWYFCAQTSFKLHFNFDYILKNILEKDPDSLIILIKNNKELYTMHESFKNRLLKNDVDLNRIIFVDKMAHHNMMAVYNNTDVVLDSFFFGGDTTTREAFEVGAPIITLPHKYLGSRWTQAYYNHIGVTELIAKNLDNYVELAVKVGTDKNYSNNLKTKIKNNSHKLFNSKNASLAWEKVFIDLYEKECNIETKNIIKSKDNIRIPKIIIQTWKTSNLPNNLLCLTNKIKKLHPDFEYKFFDDNDVDTFIKNTYPEYYDIFNNFKYNIQKYDFFRYLAVYHYGGFYLDMDMNITSSFEELCSYDCVFPREFKKNTDIYLQNKGLNMLLGNYAFGASKNNLFIKSCIDNIVNDNINVDESMGKEKYTYYKTGPVLVSSSYIDYPNKELIHILFQNKNECFGIFGEHMHFGSWKDKIIGGTELIFNRISEKIDFSKINLITKGIRENIDPNKKTIYWCHDNPSDIIYKNINNNIDAKFVFVSENQKNNFINYFNLDKEKCSVIRNAIIPIPKHLKNNNICRLIYHSTPNRGLDILIKVYEELVPVFLNNGIYIHLDVYSSFRIYNRPDLHLDKPYYELYKKIHNHPHMTYHGSVPNNEIRNALMNSHIFAYPSTYYETSCLCLIEAMSAGCLCVHSSYGALPETANNHTIMYEYCDNKFEHCTRFANSLIKAVLNYKNISLDDQIKYINNTFDIKKAVEKWKTLI